jgi:hypothetical protein
MLISVSDDGDGSSNESISVGQFLVLVILEGNQRTWSQVSIDCVLDGNLLVAWSLNDFRVVSQVNPDTVGEVHIVFFGNVGEENWCDLNSATYHELLFVVLEKVLIFGEVIEERVEASLTDCHGFVEASVHVSDILISV